jgi:hypothetical protein
MRKEKRVKKKNRYTMAGTFSKVMAKFYREPETVQEAVDHLRPHRWLIEQLYEKSLAEDVKLNKEYGFNSEPDLRSGQETYGYKSDESITCNLQYISDRWRAPFRLRWLLDLIDKYK